MEKQVIFRDYQEQQAQDHTDLQDYARLSFDHLVKDAVTTTRRYAGFNATKTAQTEVQVAAGRFYDSDGAVYSRSTTLTQSMVTYLPAVAKRYVSLTAYGNETETDIEERDFLVDVDTGRTEPDAVATTSSRDAVLAWVTGTESADPQPPSIPVSSVEICRILLDTTQVSTVTMMSANEVVSTEDLDERTDDLEEFEALIGPRVYALASDLAALRELVKGLSGHADLSQVYQDLARVKERVDIAANAVDYGADCFLDENDTDADNSQSLGYDAKVWEGCRFPWANEDMFETNVFSANDPNAHVQGGLLLPDFTHSLKIEIGPYHEDLGIAQYGFAAQTITHKQIARTRREYGDWWTLCSNYLNWLRGAATFDPVQNILLYQGETYEPDATTHEMLESGQRLVGTIRLHRYWETTYNVDYWDVITTEHNITGAHIAQTVLVANDMWLTKVGFYLTAKAANEDVHIAITRITTGMPDLSKAILYQTVPHTSLQVGGWTEVEVQPTFLRGGGRYAFIFISNANHKVGMAYGQQYLDGTFFYSTDLVYYLGDLMKDMMLRLYGAKFNCPQVTIELTALNLDGGIRDLDILAGMIIPKSTLLIWEVQPGGSGAWIPIDPSDLTAFATAPPLARCRVRFIGTRDIQAGLMLTGSRITMFRPKVAFTHISEPQTLAAPSSEIHVKLLLENYNETPHDVTCQLRIGANWLDPVMYTTTTIDANEKRYARDFKFVPSSATSTFTIKIGGTTNSATDTFHVAERIYWSL